LYVFSHDASIIINLITEKLKLQPMFAAGRGTRAIRRVT
jgi:hypothetical protein